MKNLISPVLIILSGLIVYLYAMPLYGHIGQLQNKKSEQEVVLSSIRNMGTRLSEIEAEYQSFSPREQGLLTTLIPRTLTESVVVTDVTAMAINRNLSIEGVNFEEKIDEQATVQILNEDGSPIDDQARPYREWDMTIEVEGDYENFIDFVIDLGRSIRITDVSEISIASEQEGVGSAQNVKYEISAIIYSLE